MIEFELGEVVRLKSGGPKMTVTSLDEGSLGSGPEVWCEWFDDKTKVQSGGFAPTSLEKVPPDAKPGLGARGKPGSWMG